MRGDLCKSLHSTACHSERSEESSSLGDSSVASPSLRSGLRLRMTCEQGFSEVSRDALVRYRMEQAHLPSGKRGNEKGLLA